MNVIVLIVCGSVTVAAALVLFLVAAAQARAVERSASQDRAHDLRVLFRRLARTSALCGALAGGVCAGLTDWSRIAPVAAAATIAVVLACVILPVAAARRPVTAAYARERGIPVRALRSSPRQLAGAVIMIFLVGWPAAVALAASHRLVAQLAVLVAGYVVVNPLISGLLGPVFVWARSARALPADVQQRLSVLAGRIGVGVRGRVVPGRERKIANAWQLGWLPGLRYVLITDYLLDELAAAEADAVVAHELGHGRHHDARTRQLLTCAFMASTGCVAVALAANEPALDAAGIAAVAVTVLTARRRGASSIRRELAADDVAVAACGPEAVAAMLERLTELNAIKRDTSRSWDRSVGHPGMAQRIARLRAGGPPAPAATAQPGIAQPGIAQPGIAQPGISASVATSTAATPEP